MFVQKNNIVVGSQHNLSFRVKRLTNNCCLKDMNSCATVPSEHFLTIVHHPPLLASSSLGFVLWSHFSVRKLKRFLLVQLVLRRLHLCYLHSPLARISLLGISWRLQGLPSFCWALVVCLVEFYGTVLNAREFLLDNYLVCWHKFTCINHFFRCI